MLKWFLALLKSESGVVNLANIMMIGSGIIFMGIGAMFIPVMLTGFGNALTNGYINIFTGTADIVKIAPTLIVLGFVVAGAVVGFLGIKGMSQSD